MVRLKYTYLLFLVTILLCFALCEHNKYSKNKKKHGSHHEKKFKHRWQHSRRNSVTVDINVQDRTIKGTINETSTGQTKYHAFLGIPYAKPPLEDLRFEPPQSYRWEGIYDATYQRNICIQNSFPSGFNIEGSEDCLYLNVYTPINSYSSPLSVMVWIHGGSFLHGNGNYESNPVDRFLDEDLVVVTLNYRLGVFGFLTTGDGVVPGNMGLKDQVLALKWVKENIRYFGGNSQKVTIMGQSAGGASVTYLVQSPMTKGLFAKAIAQSGNSLCPWAVARRGANNTQYLANKLFIFSKNSTEIVGKLKEVDAKTLSSISTVSMGVTFLLGNPLNGLIYAPVIEPPNPTELFSSKSYEQINSCNLTSVSLITGYTSEEAKGANELLGLLRFYLARYDLDPSGLVPQDMNVNTTQEKNKLGAEIKETYVGTAGLITSSSGFNKYLSDDLFVRPTIKYANLYAKCGKNVFQYRFSYTQSSSGGVFHADELPYFFNNGSLQEGENKTFSIKVVKLWSNFIKTGNPTPDNTLGVTWYPSTEANNHSYLDIGNEFVNHDQETNPDKSYLDKWSKWYDTYGNRPYDTY